MHEQTAQSPRHEPTDIDTRPLRITAIVILICGLIIPLALFWLFKYYEKTVTHPDEDLIKYNAAAPQSPEPRVQGIPGFHDPVPRADMEKYRKESDQRLHSYGPTDDPNFIHIPIDRAIDLLSSQPTTQRAK
jgi:hypothetical protein